MSAVNPVRFANAVKNELKRARELHGNINSLHEGYAIILEELDELWEEARKRRESREPGDIAKELVQIAAMAQRTCEDLGYYTELPQIAQES